MGDEGAAASGEGAETSGEDAVVGGGCGRASGRRARARQSSRRLGARSYCAALRVSASQDAVPQRAGGHDEAGLALGALPLGVVTFFSGTGYGCFGAQTVVSARTRLPSTPSPRWHS
eukprot:5230058-Prymnesium_polylepis.1